MVQSRHVPAVSCVPENAIVAFGNGSDVKTDGGQPGMPSPATDNQSPHLATTAPGVSMETEQNILKAQIPTQVRRDGLKTENVKYSLFQTERH